MISDYLVDLRRQALLYSQGNIRANEWEAAIRRGLGEKASEYEKVGCLRST